MLLAGRLIGIAAAAATLGLWLALLYFNPYGSTGTTTMTYVLATVMVFGAMIAGFGAASDKPWPLFAAFAVSCIPVGWYMLGAEGPFRWIGVASLAYLVSGLLLKFAARPRKNGKT